MEPRTASLNGKEQGTIPGDGSPVSSRNAKRNKRRSSSRTAVVDSTIEVKTVKKPARKSLTKKGGPNDRAGADGAAKRAGKSLGIVPLPFTEPLPFQATLAFAFRGVGGKATAIEGARLVQNDVRFSRLVYAWEQLSASDRTEIRLEDLCATAEITTEEFVGLVVPALWRRNVDIGKLVGGFAIAPVVEAVAQRAQGAFGMPDAKMILDMNGLLPTSKGVQVNIDNSKKTLNVTKGVDLSEAPGMPSFETSVSQTTQAIRGDASATSLGAGRQKSLPAPEIILDAEVSDVEVVNVSSGRDQQED